MIDRHSLLALNFYKSSPFTGSDGNMRYRDCIIDAVYNLTAEALERGGNYEIRS